MEMMRVQDDETCFPSSDGEFSEEEIEQQAEESATDQENTSDESEGEKETAEEFFIGKINLHNGERQHTVFLEKTRG